MMEDLGRRIFGKFDPGALERRLGAVNQLLLLAVLREPTLGSKEDAEELIKNFKDASDARNHGIFAHGVRALDRDSVSELKELVIDRKNKPGALIKTMLNSGPLVRDFNTHRRGVLHLTADGRRTGT